MTKEDLKTLLSFIELQEIHISDDDAYEMEVLINEKGMEEAIDEAMSKLHEEVEGDTFDWFDD